MKRPLFEVEVVAVVSNRDGSDLQNSDRMKIDRKRAKFRNV